MKYGDKAEKSVSGPLSKNEIIKLLKYNQGSQVKLVGGRDPPINV